MSTETTKKLSKREIEIALEVPLPDGTIQAREGAKVKNKKTGELETQFYEYVEHTYVRGRFASLFGLDFDCEVEQLATKEGRSENGRSWYCTVTVKLKLELRARYDDADKRPDMPFLFSVTKRQAFGAHTSYDRDQGSAYEKALKAAESDAWKRIGLTFGVNLGLGLEQGGEQPQSESPAERRAQQPHEDEDETVPENDNEPSTSPQASGRPTKANGQSPAASSGPPKRAELPTPARVSEGTEDLEKSRAALIEVGFEGDMLERLMGYPSTQLVPQDRFLKAMTALGPNLGTDQLAQCCARLGVDVKVGDNVTGYTYRKILYAASKAARVESEQQAQPT